MNSHKTKQDQVYELVYSSIVDDPAYYAADIADFHTDLAERLIAVWYRTSFDDRFDEFSAYMDKAVSTYAAHQAEREADKS